MMIDKTHVKKYLPEHWNGIAGKYRQNQTMLQTLKEIQQNIKSNGLSTIYNGRTLTFDSKYILNFDVNIVFSDLPEGVNSHYNSNTNTICFNKKIKNDGILIYSLLHHEYVHKLQYELSKQIHRFDVHSNEYAYLSSIYYDAHHKNATCQAFDIKFVGQPYVDPLISRNSTLSDGELIDALYRLQLSERNASDTEKQALLNIFEITSDKHRVSFYIKHHEEKLKQAIDVIRQECKCFDLSYEEICKNIDSAKNNIINNREPTYKNDIEALLMYKIAILLRAQNDLNQDELIVREEYNQGKSSSAIKRALNSTYIESNNRFNAPGENLRVGDIVFVNDLFDISNCDANMLHQLDANQQASNPLLVAYAVIIDEQDAVAEIKNIDTFKLWYYSNHNSLSTDQQKAIANILGLEFSPEYRLTANQIFNEQFNQYKQNQQSTKDLDVITNDERYVFDNLSCDEQIDAIDRTI